MSDAAMVSMTSITDHSYDAIDRPMGTVYDVDPRYVDTLIALHFARRTEHMTPKKTKAHIAPQAPTLRAMPEAPAVPTTVINKAKA
jgi:hypothetical protein